MLKKGEKIRNIPQFVPQKNILLKCFQFYMNLFLNYHILKGLLKNEIILILIIIFIYHPFDNFCNIWYFTWNISEKSTN